MCGICGEVSGGGVTEPALAAMAGSLEHRGPDHGASYVAPGAAAGFGFRRLSIIDLRAAANQPLGNEDGSVQLVFNGEIYNFQELRRGLVSRGHVFRSNTDSEVIVHLYEELGDRAIDQLEGMFALALWDTKARKLLLARDRAGKKPLFVWQGHGRVVFASEIKAIAAHPQVTLDIDTDAIPYYFLHGYVPHPRTFYRGVSHVEPGTVVQFDDNGRRTERRYWQLTFPSAQQARLGYDHRAAVARVRGLVTAAVQRRLISDVPLGAFLSGGIDSAIVVGVMSRLASAPVRTFSIGFEGDPAFDESAAARATAAHFRTEHTEFRVRPSAVDLLDTLVYHHDGPFADSSAIPTYLVAKLTRQKVTVALTGDGGDELFAGYLRFAAALAAERTPRWAALAAPLLGALPRPKNERSLVARSARFVRHMRLPLEDRLTAFAGVFFDDLDRILDPAFAADVGPVDRRLHHENAGADSASPLSRLLAANFHSYLHDDLLVKADRMTMANSLEARSPFLDRELIEYVAGLPDEDKLSGMTTKVILREAFADILPPAVMRAPKKGFGVPLEAWFRGELRDVCRDTLLAPSAKLRAFVSQSYVRTLIEDHEAGRANHGHRLWTVLTFERWLQLLPSWGRPR
ncbi:MAG TPA: asparagine synthase (glutamine-hydrolyzing) [Vicinamibacterales bacterium]